MPKMWQVWVIRFGVFGFNFGLFTLLAWWASLPQPYIWSAFVSLFIQKKLLRSII